MFPNWSEKRLIMKEDLSLKTGTVTIKMSTLCENTTFCISGLSKIELIVNARITNTEPKTCNIHAPQVWHVTGTSIVGISLCGPVGITGTTVTMSVDAMGHASD